MQKMHFVGKKTKTGKKLPKFRAREQSESWGNLCSAENRMLPSEQLSFAPIVIFQAE